MANTTTYSYTWYPGSVQPQTVITTLPFVPTSANGTGAVAQSVAFYDAQGNLTWSKDARGFLTENLYDPLTDLLVKSVADANTSVLSGLPIDPLTGTTLAALSTSELKEN